MSKDLQCKKCGSSLLQKTGNKIKIRTNIIVFEKAEDGDFSDAVIKCQVCKTDNQVPIVFNTNMEDKELKLFIFENEKK